VGVVIGWGGMQLATRIRSYRRFLVGGHSLLQFCCPDNWQWVRDLSSLEGVTN